MISAYDPRTRDKTHLSATAADECREWLSWLAVEGKAPVTREDYERTIAVLLRTNPVTPFSSFTPQQVMDCLTSYPRGSQRKVRAHLMSFFQWGVLVGRIDRNPLDRIPKIRRQPQALVEVFDDVEVAALEDLPVRDGALFTLMFHTGLRKTECRNLRRRDINLEKGELRVLNSKGGKSRIVPFLNVGDTSPVVRAIVDLDFLERLNPEDHLWYSIPGGGTIIARDKPVGDGTFHRWYARCLEAAGVLYVPRSQTTEGVHNPHTTRHTYVTRCLRRGVPLAVVSQWCGHASIGTTWDLYGHLEVTDTRKYLGLLAPVGEDEA